MAVESSVYPLSKLFVGPEKTVAISGPHIHILSSLTGEPLHSTLQFSAEEKERDSVVESGPVICAVVDETFRYLAEVGEDKLLKLWQIGDTPEEGLELLNSRELPKKPTSIIFTNDSQTILVTDKFGDVFSYPLVYTPFTTSELEAQQKAKEKDQFASHTNPSNGTLVLGHVSPLNALLLSPDEKYIITADRDEHVRVSWYPQGFNIEMYCLGHTKFVSALHIPSKDPTTLISGGGDPVLKLWDWMTGKEKAELRIADAVEPFIVVKKVLGKNQWEGDDDDVAEGESNVKGKKSKRKKGKSKGRGQPKEQTPTGAMDVDDPSGDAAIAVTLESTSDLPPTPQKVLAVRRIETLLVEDAATFILFSSIGSTALFSSPYPSLSPENETSLPSSQIRHLDFKKPVIDFYILPSALASFGSPLVCVVLDAAWGQCDESSNATGSDRVRLVMITSSGELAEVDGERREGSLASLLNALNGPATKVAASAKELKSLDLYSELVSLPKFIEKTTLGDDDAPQMEGKPPSEPGGSGSSSSLTKRKLGRMKRTAKVEEVIKQKRGVTSLHLGQEATNDGDGDDSEEEPGAKRARSSSADIE